MMKLVLTPHQIKEIAGYLDSGMTCYYNTRTGEIKHLLESDDYFDLEEDPWAEEIKEVEDNRDQYVEFTGMLSGEAYKVMVGFAESVDNIDLQYKLIKALERPGPFRNFKWLVDNSGPYRQKWFEYKDASYIRYVEEQIEEYNDLMEQQQAPEDSP